MKILVIAPIPFFVDRGTPIRVKEESVSLCNRGFEVDIATYHIGKNIQKNGLRIFRILPVFFWYKKTESGPSWQKIFLDFFLLIRVYFLFLFGKYDIIHAHLHEGVLIGWMIQKMFFWRKTKLVIDLHGRLSKEMESHGFLKNGFLKFIFLKIEEFLNKKGDFCVVSSSDLKKEILKFRNSDTVEVVLDGVDLEKYRKLSGKKEDLRRELEIPNDKTVVVYAGAFLKNKGIESMLDILKECQTNKKCNNIFFVLAGGPLKEIENELNEIKVNNLKVISPLNFEDVSKINSSADLAIDPKSSEFGQASGKILEYMGAGLPVVCRRNVNNENYLGDGGMYVENNFVDEFFGIIERCEKDKKYIIEKSEIVKNRVLDYGWEKSGEKLELIYIEIMKLGK